MPAKKVILFLGPPSSGKTTQGKMAKDAMEGEAKIQHVSTGDLIRENIRAGTDMGKQMAVDIKETGGVRDELVLAAVGELLVSSEAEDILIIDGFPRTLMQAQWIKARVSPQNLSLIVFASGKEDTLKQRALGRRINKKTGAVYSTLAKEGFMKIPEGAEVERREFDSDISQRLSMYRNYESRILPLFQQKFTVDAQGTPASVHAEVMSIMSKVSQAYFLKLVSLSNCIQSLILIRHAFFYRPCRPRDLEERWLKNRRDSAQFASTRLRRTYAIRVGIGVGVRNVWHR